MARQQGVPPTVVARVAELAAALADQGLTPAQQVAIMAAMAHMSGDPLNPIVTVNVTIPPSTASEILLARNRTKQIGVAGLYQFSVTVAAGASYILAIPNPAGYITVFIGGLKITATEYGAGIIATATVDNQPITGAKGSTYEYQIVGPDEIVGVEYTYVKNYVEFTITNNTGADTTITFKLENLSMDQDTFNNFWLGLNDLTFAAVQGAIAAWRAATGTVSAS